ncbi:hypothetical protein [Actinoplanes solisilvae]|uniref:hypothetical protein n=1 Tax=Actinoplanes solisilvae TaxID=2486853 RepID=UPI000FD9D80D|nr:hypothetical protein [Actinoplanes solisilvae]
MLGMMAFPVAVSAAHRPIWWQWHSKLEPLVLRPRAVVVAYVLLAIFLAVMNHSIAMIIMDLSLSATAPITAIVVGFLITLSGPAMFRAAPGNADSIRDVSPEEIYSSACRRLIERVLLTSTCATVAVAALFLSSVWETSPLLVPAVAVVTTFSCCIFALSLGQSLGPVIGLAVVELALLPTGRRVSFMKLLRQAADRQVLRQAGRVFQFRHAELQDLLANLDTDGDSLVRAAPAADR